MKKAWKKAICLGSLFLGLFVIWTILIQIVDVRKLGQNGTEIGFAAFNIWFHQLTGVNMKIYTITDWLGLVPVFICISFGILGLVQFITRKSLLKVDKDILVLGIYYVIVISAYVLFEMIPINYRPVLIGGIMEASYPSSTTLLVLCVMASLAEQMNRRVRNHLVKRVVLILTILFSVFMVLGRCISGVHWFTDILGAIFLSAGLFYFYKGFVFMCKKE